MMTTMQERWSATVAMQTVPGAYDVFTRTLEETGDSSAAIRAVLDHAGY